MISLPIHEISADAGPLSDGISMGRVDQSLLTAAMTDVRVAPTVYLSRKDVTATGVSFAPIADPLVSFNPWGTLAAMSLGDEQYVACNDPIKELFVRIGTPGVWTGTGLQIAYSSDGKTANKTVAGLVDASNGFRAAAGIYRVTFTQPTDLVAFSPLPGSQADVDAGRAVAERRWLVLRPAGLTAVTTAPILSGLWIVHADANVTHTAITTTLNAALADGSFGTVSDVFYAEGNETVFVFPFLAYGLDATVHRRVANAVSGNGAAPLSGGPGGGGAGTGTGTTAGTNPRGAAAGTQGFAGGNGNNFSSNAGHGGGGGGAGGVGGNSTASSSGGGSDGKSGDGGIGILSDITGTSIGYGGGGVGGRWADGAAAANLGTNLLGTPPVWYGGGAGEGATANSGTGVAGQNGAANRGGGGGGGGDGGKSGGNGGSGVVIIRFPTTTRSYQALQTFVDDTAARAGGLLVGQFFRETATRALRQVE